MREAYQASQARTQRREQLVALLAAEGLDLAVWQYRIPGTHGFINHGSGSAEALVAQAVAASQAANPPPGLQAYAV